MSIVLEDVQHIPFFRQLAGKLEPALLRNFLGKCNRRHYEPGRIVFRRGDPVDCIYAVEEGKLEILNDIRLSLRENDRPQHRSKLTIAVGEVFGDINIGRNSTRRTQTIRAVQSSSLIQVPVNLYMDYEGIKPGAAIEDVKIPLCEWLPAADRASFSKMASTRVYNYNQVVYNVDDAAIELFFIVSGEFRREERHGAAVNYYQAGCSFGYEEIVKRSRRTHTVVCSSYDAIVYVFSRSAFEEHFMSNPCALQSIKTAEQLQQRALQNISYQTNRFHQQKNNKSMSKTNRCKTTQLPEYSDNEFFIKAKKQNKFIRQFGMSRKKDCPRDQQNHPKPWFLTTTKKLLARMQRLERLTTNITNARPPQTGSIVQRMLRRVRTEANNDSDFERIRVTGLESAIGS